MFFPWKVDGRYLLSAELHEVIDAVQEADDLVTIVVADPAEVDAMAARYPAPAPPRRGIRRNHQVSREPAAPQTSRSQVPQPAEPEPTTTAERATINSVDPKLVSQTYEADSSTSPVTAHAGGISSSDTALQQVSRILERMGSTNNPMEAAGLRAELEKLQALLRVDGSTTETVAS